jgi:thioredoxin-like negative regulator of GroEL
VDADDLDYRVRTFTGCIPPRLVTRLVELGHLDEVRLQAGRWEWFCAHEWARILAAQDQHAQALQVLAPYVATGWRTAAQATAELLESWGRVDEAVDLVRPLAEAGDRLALDFVARMLARHGDSDEAFALLSPGIEDWFLATALVDIADGAGRDEDAAALLTARIGAGHRCNTPSCSRREGEPSNAIGLLATIRERQGRIDEAIALLHTRCTTSVNSQDQLADLLARHDRIDELRAYAATEYHGAAARRLAEFLEERGDVEGAIAVYRDPGDSVARQIHGVYQLARLLARHGRGDEATQVLRAYADSPGGAEDWIVHALCTHYIDQGRAADGLAYLDALKAHEGGEEWEFFQMRLWVMAAAGRRVEAIDLARSHPESGTWYADRAIAELLAGAGRIDEAVALLEPRGSDSRMLAEYLLDLGRIKEALAILQQPSG